MCVPTYWRYVSSFSKVARCRHARQLDLCQLPSSHAAVPRTFNRAKIELIDSADCHDARTWRRRSFDLCRHACQARGSFAVTTYTTVLCGGVYPRFGVLNHKRFDWFVFSPFHNIRRFSNDELWGNFWNQLTLFYSSLVTNIQCTFYNFNPPKLLVLHISTPTLPLKMR